MIQWKCSSCGHTFGADALPDAGANYVDEEVVRDGNLITSRKP